MKPIVLSISFLAFLLAITSLVYAQDLHYLGKSSGQETGWIQISGKDYEISEGFLIPGWGTVRQITETHLVLDKALSEEDKEGLRLQGADGLRYPSNPYPSQSPPGRSRSVNSIVPSLLLRGQKRSGMINLIIFRLNTRAR